MQNHFPITHEFHPQIAPNFVLYLNSSHGNWIYMMTTVVVVVVVVVMHASKNKILTLNDFAEDLIKFVHFFLNWKTWFLTDIEDLFFG